MIAGRLIAACIVVASSSSLARDIADIEAEIGVVKAQLASATTELAKHAQTLDVTHDVQADLKYRPVQQFLRAMTVPEYRIVAKGTRATGDVLYQSNARVWIEPADKATVALAIRTFELDHSSIPLRWRADLGASAHVNLKYSIFGINGNIPCDAATSQKVVRGSMEFGAVNGFAVPYVVKLAPKTSINVNYRCPIDQTGFVWTHSEPVSNLAEVISEGTLELAFGSEGFIDLPSPDGVQRYRYVVSQLGEPRFSLAADHFDYRMNLQVQVFPPR
jgi:hypothetical protein